MTNIQILFLCSLIIICIGLFFVLLAILYKQGKQIKELKADSIKITEYCNSLFDKLKEVVNKVNPLLIDISDDNIQDAEVKNN